MAIKVAFSAALLVALVALASAATITTTVTTTSYDESRSQQQQQCRRQLQGRQLRDCQRYLTQQQYLEMATENPQHQQDRAAEACCQSLKAIERQQQQCGCEAVRHAVKQVQEKGQMDRSEQMYQRAKMLPRVCGLRTQQCRLNVIFF